MIRFQRSKTSKRSRPCVDFLCLFVGVASWAGFGELEAASAQAVITDEGLPITESFVGLAASGTSNVLPLGWFLLEGGANANDSYAAGTGSSNTGNTYSFGVGATSERAFGMLRSGNLAPTIGAVFLNATGSTLTSLEVAYWGEQWRLGTAGRQDRLDFQYSLDASSLATGNWTDVDALDFSTPAFNETLGAKLGDDPAYRGQRQATLPISVAPGATVWFRWNDFDASGADDGLAVDDITVTAFALDTAPSVVTSFPAPGALDVPLDGQFSVTFSEAVDVVGAWAEVSCEPTGVHVVNTSGGPVTFTIDVVGALLPGESCVLTVFSADVTDLDVPVDAMTEDYVAAFATLGGTGCGAPATPIHAIQGTGSSSLSVGDEVTVEGVVVGDFQGSDGLTGFFVQEEPDDADADPLTSEGLFVFDPAGAVDVVAGDVVRITGTVSEYFELTELSELTDVLVCGSAAVPQTVVNLPVTSTLELERFEGMLVSLNQPLTVSETYDLGRYGEVLLSASGRLMQPTSISAPGAAALATQAQNRLASIQLDDGSSVQNPATPPYLGTEGTLRIGDTTTAVTGVLGYSFGNYEVHPTAPVVFNRDNPRPPVPQPLPGGLRVAAFNVLNYFTTLDTGAAICGPSSNLDCRGANTATEFGRQRQKILAALSSIDADVVGLVELENNASAAIADLVAGLNVLLGSSQYQYVDTGTIGTDAIKVGLIYKASSVELLGDHAILDSSVDPNFVDTLNRPVLAQTFRHLGSGEVFTVAVNHLKSKGSACAGDPDTGDLQGNCNLTRLAAAQAEIQWLATDPTNSGDADFLVIGDLNAYAKEQPIAAFEGSGYVNLVDSSLGSGAYSYVFGGQSGYLDHALATAQLASKVGRVTEWHINADEPRILDYNQEFNPAYLFQANAFRSADHDPIIVDIEGPNAVPLPRWGAGGIAVLLLVFGAFVSGLRRTHREQ